MLPEAALSLPLPLSFQAQYRENRKKKCHHVSTSRSPLMEKHTCKLCFRRFSNGRALGGHMRSHVSSATPTTKLLLQDSSAFPPSFSSSDPEEAQQVAAEVAEQVAMEEEEGKGGLIYYGLRENPKKSFRLVDPEFSSTFVVLDYAAAAGASSVVVQDRESETESSKSPSVRRRSKRRRRSTPPKPEPSEPEPVSSVSDTTPEEDVALCLMMLSRDVWNAKKEEDEQEAEEDEEEEEEQMHQQSDGSDEEEEEERIAIRSRRGGRSKYQCGTCKKVFRSYQALGGHRASHKKVRGCIASTAAVVDDNHRHHDYRIHDADSKANATRRIHECPVCFRVFGSGQALGGHKRSHLTSSSAVNPSPLLSNANAAAAASSSLAATTSKLGESWIDLNLPAPMEEDATSQVELSAVSDAE